jgi:hypothetical protein
MDVILRASEPGRQKAGSLIRIGDARPCQSPNLPIVVEESKMPEVEDYCY